MHLSNADKVKEKTQTVETRTAKTEDGDIRFTRVKENGQSTLSPVVQTT
jgi:hypothetical protein